MTINVLQEKLTSSGAGFVGSVALTFNSPVTAGSSFHVIWQHNTAVTTYTVSDDKGNVYGSGALDTVIDTAGGTQTSHQTAQNVASGTTTVTVTFTAVTRNFVSLWIKEIGQAATTGNPDGHNGVASSSTTSQNLTCTSANQPALISVLSSNSNTQEVPVLDATFTASSLNPGWNYGGGTSSTIAGHKRVTATGTQSVTNTQSVADGMATVMAVFDEVAGVSDTLMAQACL